MVEAKMSRKEIKAIRKRVRNANPFSRRGPLARACLLNSSARKSLRDAFSELKAGDPFHASLSFSAAAAQAKKSDYAAELYELAGDMRVKAARISENQSREQEVNLMVAAERYRDASRHAVYLDTAHILLEKAGDAYAEAGRYRNAVSSYSEALRLLATPSCADIEMESRVREKRADSELRAENPDCRKAAKDYSLAAELEYENPGRQVRLYIRAGDIFSKLNDTTAALKEYNAALKAAEDADQKELIRARMDEIEAMLGEVGLVPMAPEEVQKELERCMSAGERFESEGDLESALSAYRDAREWTNDAEVRETIKAKIAALEEKTNPEPGAALVEVPTEEAIASFLSRAEAYEEEGDYSRALNLYGIALEMSSDPGQKEELRNKMDFLDSIA